MGGCARVTTLLSSARRPIRDPLIGAEWDHRGWQKHGSVREDLLWLAVGACLRSLSGPSKDSGIRGAWIDSHVYAILENEWRAHDGR